MRVPPSFYRSSYRRAKRQSKSGILPNQRIERTGRFAPGRSSAALLGAYRAKHAFVREPGALARLVLLLFLAFVLLQASRLRVEAGKAPLGLAPAWEPIAFRFLRQLLWISLGRMQPVGGG
jgi:hypothetical protein